MSENQLTTVLTINSIWYSVVEISAWQLTNDKWTTSDHLSLCLSFPASHTQFFIEHHARIPTLYSDENALIYSKHNQYCTLAMFTQSTTNQCDNAQTLILACYHARSFNPCICMQLYFNTCYSDVRIIGNNEKHGPYERNRNVRLLNWSFDAIYSIVGRLELLFINWKSATFIVTCALKFERFVIYVAGYMKTMHSKCRTTIWFSYADFGREMEAFSFLPIEYHQRYNS